MTTSRLAEAKVNHSKVLPLEAVEMTNSLTVTILDGKIDAILWRSMWFSAMFVYQLKYYLPIKRRFTTVLGRLKYKFTVPILNLAISE